MSPANHRQYSDALMQQKWLLEMELVLASVLAINMSYEKSI